MWDELYHDVIIDHGQNSKHKRSAPESCCQHNAHNSMCGDEITVWIKQEGDQVIDIGFTASGCLISQASASLLCETIKGMKKPEAQQVINNMLDLLTGKIDHINYEDLMSLSEIKRFPMRVKCASMSWHIGKILLQ